MAAPVLEGKGLRKVFDGVVAVDDVSFSIEAKTITAIIGPNGAGKTTLFNLITGFISPDEGVISLKGSALNGTASHRISRMGIGRTFQDLRLLRQVSVEENLLLACPNQKGEIFLPALVSRAVRAEEAFNILAVREQLDFVGLSAMAGELAGNLSYGQQKLLSLACCLAMKGDLLPGSDADVVIWDPARHLTYGLAHAYHRTDYNLYEGWELVGFPENDFLRGRLIVDGDKWLGARGMGQFLPRSPAADVL